MRDKVKIVYHLYLDDTMNPDGVFFNLHRKCLKKYNSIFSEALFCIALDDTSDSRLIKMGIDFITSCGPWKNLTVKVKQNTVYGDAQTFYDEIIDNIENIDSMVFFGHGKGLRKGDENNLSQKQWAVFSYYSCLDNIEEKVANLANYGLVYGYAPICSQDIENTYHWFYPGTFFLFNPMKLSRYIKQTGIAIPKIEDRYSAEMFWGNIYDANEGHKSYTENFDNTEGWFFFSENGIPNFYGFSHTDFIKIFLGEERTADYVNFYNEIEKQSLG